ncbi:hypothetical protein SAMN05428987_5235 [Paenibacillus sp. CF095]|uniref:hypothetical protein n=1 Tax=Paenibacillus sp. CF095 TaxID=1881033 RepID=UPI0008898988|nr:hypothetical protein [Paenibacillus sp. CF095]SDD54726.1 hypothetical protein SAMN05428987_5235 [Paenibacillus sp. CF095]
MSSNANTSEKQDEVIIGARALGDQIYKIMPTYDLLLEQLKETRLIAEKQYDKSQHQRSGLNKQDFNNTVGIFGPRGTGKSSALYTLRDELSDDKLNILLPLIEPDNFGENTKIIGSIVGLLCEEGRKLLHLLKYESDVTDSIGAYFNNGILKPNNPLRQIIDETIEYHLYTERQYRDILGQNYADFATHIRKSERLLIPDIEFKKKLMILIDTIVNLKKLLASKEKISKNGTLKADSISGVPLIYIFIDDIDLKTSKTRELMDALLQYTNHPNIITVLSGDYEILTESLTLALLQDEPLQELGLGAYDSLKLIEREIGVTRDEDLETRSAEKKETFTILKRKTGLAHEYLKKIIPPARRHQLVKWNEKTIPNFGFGDETLLDQLVKLLGEWSIFSYKEIDKKKREATRKAIYRSYLIFDERPRGIVNAYYHLNQLLKAKQDEKPNELEKHFQLVKAFIDTLILSNSKLLPQQEFIYEKFLLWGSEAKSSSIQYAVLNELDGRIGLAKELEFYRISLYVISEIVRNLLPDVMYDHAGYFNWRRRVMNDLLNKPSDLKKISEKNIKDKYLIRNQYSDYRLFFLVETLSVLAKPEISALLAELISNTELKLYYKSRWNSDDAQAQDEFVIQTIHELLIQEEELRKQRQLSGDNREDKSFTLLEEIYHQAYFNENDDKSDLANFSINLIESLCAETAEVVTAERQFKLMMNEWDIALEEAKKQVEKGPDQWIAYMKLQIKRSLFLNSIISIKNKENIEYKFDDKSTHIGHTLSIINTETEKSGDSSKVPDAVYSTLENRMKNFAKDLLMRFTDKEMYVDLDQLDANAKNDFLKEYSGISYTRYDQAKGALRAISNTVNLTFDLYWYVLRTIEELSQNNRVYYGRQEAALFLPILRNASMFPIDAFTDLEMATIQQYAKYIGTNHNEAQLDTYENAKKFIHSKLNEAHKQLQLRTLADIKGYNLELRDLDSDQLSENEKMELRNDYDLYLYSEDVLNWEE